MLKVILTAIAVVAIVGLFIFQQVEISSLKGEVSVKADNINLQIDEKNSITLTDFVNFIFQQQLNYEKSKQQ